MRVGSIAGPLELGGDYFRWVQAARSDQALPEFDDPERPAPNVGDWFISKIVDRLIEFDELVLVTSQSTDRDWAEMNETCSVLLLKGGNMLYPGWFEQNLPAEMLRKVRIPIVLIGAGIQNVPAGGVPFTPGDLASLRLIHDSCESSSVRGALSAQVLADHGITNVTVTGCPTLFWMRDPALAIRQPSLQRVGFTLRTHLYGEDQHEVRAQFSNLDQIRRLADDVIVVLQGEDRVMQQHDLVRRYGAEFAGRLTRFGDGSFILRKARLDANELLIAIHAQFDRLAGPELVDWLTVNTYSSWDPDDYVRMYRSCTMMIGCRLHSNLVALANGTPAMFLTYDDRTRELVELLGVPAAEVSEFDPRSMATADWSLFARKYSEQLYPEMVSFLDRNALPHRLPVAPMAVAT